MSEILLSPGGTSGKESTCNVGDQSSTPGSERSPGEGDGYAFQCSCLENSMHRGTWRTMPRGVAESDMTEPLTLSLSEQKGKRELSDSRQ